MAIAKYAWSARERPGLLRVRDNVIVLRKPESVGIVRIADTPLEVCE